MIKLDKPLRREIQIDSRPYTLILNPRGLRLSAKGHRRGVEVGWGEVLRLGADADRPEASRGPAPPILRLAQG